jgi:hypothetical protein
MKRGCAIVMLFGVFLGACGGGTKLDPCTTKSNPCTEAGALRCGQDNQAVEKCQADSENCLVWTAQEDCSASGKVCSASGSQPECVAGCQDRCPKLDSLRCFNDEIERCQKAASGCLEWVVSQSCTSQGLVCDDSGAQPACVPCASECSGGELRCQSDWLQECKDRGNNCFRWQNHKDCAADGAVCREDTSPAGCAPRCTDNQGCLAEEFCRKETCTSEKGYCLPRPETCPDLFDPVCGCDGKTYENRCQAAKAGVNVDHQGTCGSGCKDDSNCQSDEYCKKESCDQTASGFCSQRPAQCDNLFQPVCSCEGATFPNECLADQGGANIDYRGLCDGQRCWENSLCRAESFCKMEACTPETGICTTRPSIDQCPRLYDPVCGCDGQTYDNDCFAAASGAGVAYQGQCPTKCFNNDQCAKTEFCYFEDCNQKTGLCRPRPDGCPLPGPVSDPVCGCDGKNYESECLAFLEGVSIAHPGQCEAIVCKDDSECLAAYTFCYKKTCDAATGWCAPRAIGCWSGEVDPVCSCDGLNFDNACFARQAGKNVAYRGKCEGTHCFKNEDCASPRMFCEFSPCAIETGKCRLRPESCELVWQPVCGCDHHTYSSKCVANFMGMSVGAEGVCK